MWSGRPRPLPLTCLSREKGSRKPGLGKGPSGKLREGTTREGHDFSRPLSPSKNQPRLEDVQIPSILSSRPEQIIAKR